VDGIIANGVCHTKNFEKKKKLKCIKHAQIKNIKVNNAGRKQAKKKKKNCSIKEDSTKTFIYKKQKRKHYLDNFKSKAVSSDGNFV
jgi:hypothetical protein